MHLVWHYTREFPFSGDDWEHEETFTDDDEAVDIDPEERADLAPEIPAPPEIKQVDIHHYWNAEYFFREEISPCFIDNKAFNKLS